jgi:FAD/FMN-containing dehydrogenase
VNDILLNALDRLIAGLGDIPLVTDRRVVRRRSRDFILNEQLDGKSADLIVSPRDERDVIRGAAVCARHRVPITVRAWGTGNYGQAVPLKGGVLLDMSSLTDIARRKRREPARRNRCQLSGSNHQAVSGPARRCVAISCKRAAARGRAREDRSQKLYGC